MQTNPNDLIYGSKLTKKHKLNSTGIMTTIDSQARINNPLIMIEDN